MEMETKAHPWALLLLVLGAAAIGLAPIFVRLTDVGPTASAFWRTFLALPFFFAYMRYEAPKLPDQMPALRHDYRDLIFCGSLFAIEVTLWHSSLQYTTVANATLLSNMNPIVVALLSVWLFKESLSKVFFVGLIVGLSGAFFLAGASFEAGGTRLFGDFIGVVTAIFYGFYLLTVSRLRRRFSVGVVMFWTCLMTAIWLLPTAYFFGEQIIPSDSQDWLYIIGLAMICQVAGQGFITFAFAHLPAAFGALTLLIQPVVAAAIAWVLFEEYLGPIDAVGAGLILIGIVLARLGTIKR